MRRQILFLSFALFGLLSVVAQPQAKYSSMRHEFGVMVWHQAEQAEFIVTNSGTEPLQIVDVHPDCGCTTVEYTSQPIAPGKQGFVRVRFEAELLGHFEKYIAIYTNSDSRPHYLTITGDVVSERKEYTGDYPYQVGDVYLSSDNVEFDNVQWGEHATRVLMIYNNGKQAFEPHFMHLPKYLTAKAEPAVVRPGRTGQIVFTLRSDLLQKIGLTQGNVYLSRFPGDRIARENELFVSITMIPRTPANAETTDRLPMAELSATSLRLEQQGLLKKVKGKVMLTNTGNSNLEIGALQVYTPGLKVSTSRRVLKPGESRPIKIELHRDFVGKKADYRILLITNDPRQPKHIIHVEVDGLSN